MNKFVAFLIIILLSPLILIILTITAINLRSNPIFTQTRTVDGESLFIFYKFRSMKKMAPDVPTYFLENPQKYITKWTSFMRSYSIDELLNLLNILLGDMNFIGPRPIMPEETVLTLLRKNNGIKSKAGITGLAQINGRDFVTLTRKVACERYYERNKSFRLNIWILWRTVWMVIRKVGVSH